MDSKSLNDLQTTYNRVASEYARRIYDELKDKPLDRQLLEDLAKRLAGRGTICDIGCGPGQVARYLRDLGAEVIGIDLSPGKVEQVRQLNPDIQFRQGNMLALDVPDEAWAGIAAFYSIIHIPRVEVVSALLELKRTLQPGGLLLLAFHIGDEVVHLDEWWSEPVCADFVFFEQEEMSDNLIKAGFKILETAIRPPYPEVEHQSQRAYVLAQNPDSV